MCPDQLFVFCIHPLNIVSNYSGLHLNSIDFLLQHFYNQRCDISRLTFGLKHDATTMGRPRVWTDHREKVRKALNGHAQVSSRVLIAPSLRKRYTITTDNAQT